MERPETGLIQARALGGSRDGKEGDRGQNPAGHVTDWVRRENMEGHVCCSGPGQ